MKKSISILLVLFCLLVNTVCIKPITAEEMYEQDETTESEGVFENDETDSLDTKEDENAQKNDEIVEEISELSEEIETEDDSSDDKTQDIDIFNGETDTEFNEFEPVSKEDQEITSDGFVFEIPEEFRMRPSDKEGKRILANEKVLDSFHEMVEGEDYDQNELVFASDDIEYARQVAEIYHCDLASFENGLAVIRIADDQLNVEDIFEAALDEQQELPLVEPNYYIGINPDNVSLMNAGPLVLDDDNSLPEVNDWSGWVQETFDMPDPFLQNPGSENYQWYHEMIDTYAGWNATMGNSDIKVAIIGESVNADHEDLGGRVSIETVDELDPCYGFGNGTLVAGVIGATANNGIGGAGIAPGVEMISINIFQPEDSRYPYAAKTSSLINAINKATELEANIVCIDFYSNDILSIYGNNAYTFDYYVQFAINRAYNNGVVFVAPAGNDGSNIKQYPASYDHVISVACITRDGSKHPYSNYGTSVTVGAPGASIISTWSSEDYISNEEYGLGGGTIIAAGVVSGALALYMSKEGPINYDEAVALLKKTSAKSSSKQVGFGIVSVANMFLKSTTIPDLTVFNSSGDIIEDLSKAVPEGSYFMIDNPASGDNDTILYTTNGKKPSIKNGEIISGTVYEAGTEISLDTFEKGTTITIYAAVVNSLGVMGKVNKYTIKAPAITVIPVKIKSLGLNLTKSVLSHTSENPDQLQLTVSSLVDENGMAVDLESVEHIWTSSNPEVATVDENGLVTSIGSGSAKITLKILDGSKKNAVCTVNVIQLPETITISGQDGISPGSSATYKASVLPSNTKNKKVTWAVESSDPAIAISSNGKVTVPATAMADDYIIVRAFSAEDGTLYGEKYVGIYPKARSIKLTTYSPRATYGKNGQLSTVNLFTVDINDELHPDFDNYTELRAEIDGNDLPPVWTSSNTKVATVDEWGNVYAHNAGTAKITCTANDGSKKKATVTVKVTVPISSLNIMSGPGNALREGYSLDLNKKVSFGVQYGKPTTKKAKWTIDSVVAYGNEEQYDITQEVLANKALTIDKNNKLKLAKGKLEYLGYFACIATITARAADGTNYTASQEIWLNGSWDGFTFEDSKGTGVALPRGQSIPKEFYTEWGLQDFEITSSNPKVCAAVINLDYMQEIDYFWVMRNGKKKNYYHGFEHIIYIYASPDYKGTATITVKARDGSNKSIKLKVKVY